VAGVGRQEHERERDLAGALDGRDELLDATGAVVVGDLVGVGGEVGTTDVLDLRDVLESSLEGRAQRADGFAQGWGPPC
jgi:hypothetical protein